MTQGPGNLTKSRQEAGRVRNGRISGREEFTRKSKWLAIHQLGGAGTEVRLERAADSKQDHGKVLNTGASSETRELILLHQAVTY